MRKIFFILSENPETKLIDMFAKVIAVERNSEIKFNLEETLTYRINRNTTVDYATLACRAQSTNGLENKSLKSSHC